MSSVDQPRPAAGSLDVLRRASTATISTILKRNGVTKVFIQLKPLFSGTLVVGPAVTLRSVPGREDIAPLAYVPETRFPGHPDDAIEAVQPGDVLVHDGMGWVHEGLFGDLLTLRLKLRGAAALVTDMAIRDSARMPERDIPIFCRGTASPGGTVYNVDFNVPIGCGGILVLPGDVIAADGDGVVVIPRAMLDTVVAGVLMQEELEVFLRQRLNEGAPLRGTYPPDPATQQAFQKWRASRA